MIPSFEKANENALRFYQNKGFKISNDILGGFITVLRNN